MILFWTSSQLSVLFRNCRLLHLIGKFAWVEFLTSFEIIYRVSLNLEHWHIQWCKVQYSPMYHVIKVNEFVWLSLIHSSPFFWPMINVVHWYLLPSSSTFSTTELYIYLWTSANDVFVLYSVLGNISDLISEICY